MHVRISELLNVKPMKNDKNSYLRLVQAGLECHKPQTRRSLPRELHQKLGKGTEKCRAKTFSFELKFVTNLIPSKKGIQLSKNQTKTSLDSCFRPSKLSALIAGCTVVYQCHLQGHIWVPWVSEIPNIRFWGWMCQELEEEEGEKLSELREREFES